MTRQQRLQQLAERIDHERELCFTQAAEIFGVSEMTIRRDVEELERQGAARRVPGGVITTRGQSHETPFTARVRSKAREKEHIAQAAADLLEPGSRVMIDSGSTAFAVAKAIRGRNLGLTVLTQNLLVALELIGEPDTSVFITGGQLRHDEMNLIGPETVQSLSSYNINTFIMGVGGVDAERGFSDYNRDEAATKRAAVSASDRIIACVDASKLDQVYLLNVAALAEIDILVTDGKPDNRSISAAQQAGVQVIIVDSDVESV